MPIESETSQFATKGTSALLDRLERQIQLTAKSQGPEAVHDLRVDIRRFTQALVTFKQYFPPGARKEVRGALKMLMKLAGPVRDSDIAVKFLRKAEGADAAKLRREVRARRTDLAAKLALELKKWNRRQPLSKWRAALLPAHAAEGPGYATAGAEARHALPRVAVQLFKAGNRAAKASVLEIHAFRIQAKKFRYTIELFQPVYGPPADRWLRQLKQVQTLLGDINDCRVMRERVAELGGNHEIAARLKKRQHKKTQKFQELWETGYGAKARREWLRQIRTA